MNRLPVDFELHDPGAEKGERGDGGVASGRGGGWGGVIALNNLT